MKVKVYRGTRPEVRVKKGKTVKFAEEASGQGCGRSSGWAGTTPSADDPVPRTLPPGIRAEERGQRGMGVAFKLSERVQEVFPFSRWCSWTRFPVW